MKPKHNSLAYDRVPAGNLIVFDIYTGDQEYLTHDAMTQEANRIGLEAVQLIAQTVEAPTPETLREWLTTPSVLGGQTVEGVVIKQVEPLLFGKDKKVLMGKFVSEHFREVHKREWKLSNPTQSDVVQTICDTYCTVARWDKAIQHLRDDGKLCHDVTDISMIIKAVPGDVAKECREDIMQTLWEHFWPQIRRRVTSGLPQYYKEKLAKDQLNLEAESEIQ
jgi:hypothetical protein